MKNILRSLTPIQLFSCVILISGLQSCFFQVDTTVLLQPLKDRNLKMDLTLTTWSFVEDEAASRISSGEGESQGESSGSDDGMPVEVRPDLPHRVEMLDSGNSAQNYEGGLKRTAQKIVLEMGPGTEVDTGKLLDLKSDVKQQTGDLFLFPSLRYRKDRFEVVFPATSGGQGEVESSFLRAVIAGAVALRFMVDRDYPVREARLIHFSTTGNRIPVAETIPVSQIPGGTMVYVPSMLLGMAYDEGSVLVLGFDETKIEPGEYRHILEYLSPVKTDLENGAVPTI